MTTEVAPVAASKWGRYGKRPLVVLCLVGLVDAVDRGVLPGVITKVQEDLKMSDFQAGLLSSAIVVATLLAALPGGLLADRKDRRYLIAGVLVLWSASSALSSVVRSFAQLFVVRSALGVGDALNDPSAQSLVADYYPPEVRGRAYGWQRVVPTAGVAVGAVVGGGLGSLFGWRVAVLSVALPGLLVAVLVRRLPLPERGAGDRLGQGAPATVTAIAPLSNWESLRACFAVRSLRALLFATAITVASLAAVGFWGIAYNERASGLTAAEAAGVAGGVILLGAIVGGFAGGIATDRLRGKVKGAPLLLGAVTTASGTVLLMLSFNDGIPVYAARLPLQMVAVALIVASLPALTAMTTEVVPPQLRGTAFGLSKLFANLFAAITPPLIGIIADLHQITLPNGKVKGDLGFAFRWTVWSVLVGSALLLYGRRYVEGDLRKAAGDLD
jgi:MFS family permease